MTPDRDSALYELAIIIAEAAVDAWVAGEIAEAATEAWAREQMKADATETFDKRENEDGTGDAR